MTFLVLGRVCTRNCRFCNIENAAQPQPPDSDEPQRLAAFARELDLKYAVVTSVTRDDLEDGGAGHFSSCLQALSAACPGVRLEALIPDLAGSRTALEKLCRAAPAVIAHNLETVPSLYPEVRPQADYQRSLQLLAGVKEIAPGILTKSSLMLGLGESKEELLGVMQDLRRVNCDMLTLGQYLAPTLEHYPVREFILPELFDEYKESAVRMGFKKVVSAPKARSSYRAGEVEHV
jgi:lipoic acid synthetase